MTINDLTILVLSLTSCIVVAKQFKIAAGTQSENSLDAFGATANC